MTKAVSAVGRAIGGVVNGAVKAVSGLVKGVGNLAKQIASSKLGKAVIIAAAIYFGGAALSGGFGSSAAGGSFFSGMGAGVSSAATSLQSAWGSVLSGEFAQAGSTIGNSWGVAGQAGGMAVPQGAAAVANPVSLTSPAAAPPAAAAAPPPAAAGVNSGAVTSSGSPLGVNLPAAAPPPPPASTSFWDSIKASPYTAPALISSGIQLGGAVIQGQAQEKQLREQREYEERMAREGRDRYNTNVGAPLFASNQAPIYQSDQAAWDPYAEARAINAQRYAPRSTGVVARYMPT